MNIGGGEAADQLVRMMLSGGEVAVRLTGSAAKNSFGHIAGAGEKPQEDQRQGPHGQNAAADTDLRVFPMTQEEYREFRHKAREPKLLYAAIQNSRDPNGPNSMVDVVMPATEVERANLVFQKMMYQQPEAPRRSSRNGSGNRRRNLERQKRFPVGTRLARYQHQLSYARRERGEDDE